MNRIVNKLFFGCLLFCCSSLVAQELSGYVSGMPSIIVQNPDTETWWQMLVHNRLNFGWQMTGSLRVDAGMRNRIITGSKALLNSKVSSTFDRLNITFEKNKWKLQAGRQRINWGQTFVWNPNDIFNTYSFFDFDYPERQGCDAFRTTYYHNETSSSELAASINNDHKITAAFLHRWNWKNVDFQVVTGEQTETDFILGGAITGDIKGLNFRTEMSYFHPIKNLADTSGIVAVSAGLDYIFSNSLMLQTEVLYNNISKSSSGNGLMGLYVAPFSAKKLSICEWNLFSQISYPLFPRLNCSWSGMYFVDIKSCYAGLSLDYSVIENLDFSFIAQFFSTFGKSNLGNMQVFLGFARLKYSF
jgi:hypothetical protein